MEVGCVILTPTRELAIQINEVLANFLANLPQFSQMLIIGGNKPSDDISHLQSNGANIIIATPGRFEDLLERRKSSCNLTVMLRSLEVLILDEADRLLDMGFAGSINTILSHLPKQRRTGLFSATQTDQVESLIRAGLRNPVRITVKQKANSLAKEQRTPSTLTNYYTICECDQKVNFLVGFLRKFKHLKHMVFFSTCAEVEYFGRALGVLVKNTSVLSLHGKMKGKRATVFSEFRKLESGILVCTDVMARGVDIPEVNWVLQFDPPNNASAFVHRCGRTARIGNTGNALLFLLPTEDTYVEFIQINQKVPLQEYHDASDIEMIDILPKLRKMAEQDRAIYEKGMQAFVSFYQAYVKHECSLIFRAKDLELGKLANGFGLLQMPKMPETKGRKFPEFQASNVDIQAIPFREKSREKHRKEKLRLQQDGKQVKIKKEFQKKQTAWSLHKEKKNKRQDRRQRKEMSKKRKREQFDEDDLAELAKDAMLVKKLKRGKISNKEYEDEMGLDDDT
ncbi:ATP-dependent RNA helicase DDX55-like isoform X2 [Antedon mediterranea]